MKLILVLLFCLLYGRVIAQHNYQACKTDMINCGAVCDKSSSTDMTNCVDCFVTTIKTCCEYLMPSSPYCQEFVVKQTPAFDESVCETCALDTADCAAVCAESVDGDYLQCISCVMTMAEPCCDCFFPNSPYCADIPLKKGILELAATATPN
jgi:hypothetical protein